jgi:biopolymer transport protein ExbD
MEIRKKDMASTSEGPPINIVPMLDILTNVLIFLIMNFSVEIQLLTMSENLRPPTTTSLLKLKKEATVVSISRDKILLDNSVFIAGVGKNWEIEGTDPNNPFLIPALYEEMEKIKKKKEFIARYNPDFSMEYDVMVVGDKDVPSKVFMAVVFTLGQAGFDKIKIAGISKFE